jgi:hypothetical protein
VAKKLLFYGFLMIWHFEKLLIFVVEEIKVLRVYDGLSVFELLLLLNMLNICSKYKSILQKLVLRN